MVQIGIALHLVLLCSYVLATPGRNIGIFFLPAIMTRAVAEQYKSNTDSHPVLVFPSDDIQEQKRNSELPVFSHQPLSTYPSTQTDPYGQQFLYGNNRRRNDGSYSPSNYIAQPVVPVTSNYPDNEPRHDVIPSKDESLCNGVYGTRNVNKKGCPHQNSPYNTAINPSQQNFEYNNNPLKNNSQIDGVQYGNPEMVVGPSMSIDKPPGAQTTTKTETFSQPEPLAFNTPAAAITGFSLDMMRVIDRSVAGNTVLSPYSIAVVLALLQKGCDEQAQREIISALHLSPISIDDFGLMTLNLLHRNSRNTFRMASNIFVAEEFLIDPLYKIYASRQFGSNIEPLNFRKQPQMAVQKINQWVSEKTQGHIKNMLPPDAVNADTQMVLTNAVFFKGIWNTTFDKSRTVPLPFKFEDKSQKTTHFMHQNGKYQAGTDRRLGLDFLIMPFEGLQYSLLIIVPKESVGLCLQRLNIADIMRYMLAPTRDSIISIPKFKIRFDIDLTPPLQTLGVHRIFSPSSGLTAIRASHGEPPRVTGALHTAILSIDEQGAKAAAATTVIVNTLSLDSLESNFRFKADKPFLAFLMDTQHGVPLFAAKIVDPTLVVNV